MARRCWLVGRRCPTRITGRETGAREGYERALDLACQVANLAAEARELRNFGYFLCIQSETPRGRAMIEQSLAISERLNDIYNIGNAHQFLARINEQPSISTAAIAHYREALCCFEQVQSPEAEEVHADLRRLEG